MKVGDSLESGTTRIRTGDTRIFSPMLYQLSYGTICITGRFPLLRVQRYDLFLNRQIFDSLFCKKRQILRASVQKRSETRSYYLGLCDIILVEKDCVGFCKRLSYIFHLNIGYVPSLRRYSMKLVVSL